MLALDPDVTYCLGITAHPDPGAIARIIEPFAKLGLVPLSINARLFSDAGELTVDVQIAGIGPDQCRRIANQIAAMPVVRRVVTGEKQVLG